MICTTIANAFRGKGQRPARMSDFLKVFDFRARVTKSPAHLKMLRQQFLAGYRGGGGKADG